MKILLAAFLGWLPAAIYIAIADQFHYPGGYAAWQVVGGALGFSCCWALLEKGWRARRRKGS